MTDLRTARAITDAFGQRQAEQGNRIGVYSRLRSAYIGEIPGLENLEVTGSNPDGRPVLRSSYRPADLMVRGGSPNYAKPIIDDRTAMFHRLPMMRVIPEGDDDAALQTATKRTRALLHFYKQSTMDLRQQEASFYLAELGDCLYLLEPITPEVAQELGDPFSPPGVYINVIDPMSAFPAFGAGRMNRELRDLYLIETLDRDTAMQMYGTTGGVGKDDPVICIHYFDRTVRQLVVGRSQPERWNFAHNLGFVPAQWMCGKPTGGRYAQSDMAAALEILDETKAAYQMATDAAAWSVYPLTHVNNPSKIHGDDIETGPGATVYTEDDGSVNLIAPAGDVGAAFSVFSAIVDNLLKITGTSPVRIDNQIDRSNVSARSVSAQQAGSEQRVQMTTVAYGATFYALNQKIMHMAATIPSLRRHRFAIYGVDEGKSWTDVFTGADFGDWRETMVRFDPLMGMTRHERVAMWQQLKQQGLASGRRVLEEAGEEDPERTLREARSEAQAMQPQGQPGQPGAAPGGPSGGAPAPGGPPGAAPPPEQGAPHGGGDTQNPGAQPGPEPPFPGFPRVDTPPSRRGLGTPSPVPDIAAAVTRALSSVQTHGQIADWRPTGDGVLVEVTDHRDIRPVKDAVTAALQQVMPGAAVHVKALSNSNGRKP